MFYSHSDITFLYTALALPLLVLYVLVFAGFADRSRQKFRPAVSLRDATVATLALDISALSDVFPQLYRSPSGPMLLIILFVVFVAHLLAFQLSLRRPEGGHAENSDSVEVVESALEKLNPSRSSPFLIKLSSLYIATVILLTNGSTVLAILELVRVAAK